MDLWTYGPMTLLDPMHDRAHRPSAPLLALRISPRAPSPEAPVRLVAKIRSVLSYLRDLAQPKTPKALLANSMIDTISAPPLAQAGRMFCMCGLVVWCTHWVTLGLETKGEDVIMISGGHGTMNIEVESKLQSVVLTHVPSDPRNCRGVDPRASLLSTRGHCDVPSKWDEEFGVAWHCRRHSPGTPRTSTITFFPQTVDCWGSILERKELAMLTGRAFDLCGWALWLGLVLLLSSSWPRP